MGVGEQGWDRSQIPWPNTTEQQSATGSGDLKHVTFAPQVSFLKRVGGNPVQVGLLSQQGLADQSHKPSGTSQFFPNDTKTQ